MMRYHEEAWSRVNAVELFQAVLQMVFSVLAERLGAAVEIKPFERTTGDDWLGDVGPAMSFEDREEWENFKFGSPEVGVAVRYVREYYTSSNPDWRDYRGDEIRIAAYGWGERVEFFVKFVWHTVGVRWILPAEEHVRLFAAWEELKAAFQLYVPWPSQATPV